MLDYVNQDQHGIVIIFDKPKDGRPEYVERMAVEINTRMHKAGFPRNLRLVRHALNSFLAVGYDGYSLLLRPSRFERLHSNMKVVKIPLEQADPKWYEILHSGNRYIKQLEKTIWEVLKENADVSITENLIYIHVHGKAFRVEDMKRRLLE